jgi:SAM-dependent methyltransferase
MQRRLSIDMVTLDVDHLLALQHKPEPFTPGESLFWDDPHISRQMLAAHLDPTVDAASRRSEEVEWSVNWLIATLDLTPGDAVLDLGCGPGLYTTQLALRGLNVTGVDISRRSIDYARQHARAHQLEVAYRCENYLALADRACYNAALLIYGDFCTFNPAQRQRLLANVRRALKPRGRFALDVSTPAHRRRHTLHNRWYVADSGFWRPGPHLVLEQDFDYPDQHVHLDQYIVIEPHGAITLYRNWFQDYTIDAITAELRAAGFAVHGLWSDLAGTPITGDSEWIGIVARLH